MYPIPIRKNQAIADKQLVYFAVNIPSTELKRSCAPTTGGRWRPRHLLMILRILRLKTLHCKIICKYLCLNYGNFPLKRGKVEMTVTMVVVLHYIGICFWCHFVVCEADLYILMLYVSQLVTLPCSKSN